MNDLQDGETRHGKIAGLMPVEFKDHIAVGRPIYPVCSLNLLRDTCKSLILIPTG